MTTIEYTTQTETRIVFHYSWPCPGCKVKTVHSFNKSPDQIVDESGDDLYCPECQTEREKGREDAWREAVAAKFEHLAGATVLLVGIGDDYYWWNEETETVDPHMMLVRTQGGKTYNIKAAREGGFLIIKEVGEGDDGK